MNERLSWAVWKARESDHKFGRSKAAQDPTSDFRWQDTDCWAREVLQRAGGASLWVRTTHAEQHPKYIQNVFFHVLNNCWEQIEILKILKNEMGTMPKQWDALYHFAPRLLDLEIAISGFNESSDLKDIPLFQDHAPLLRFSCKNYKFNSQASWLANLRSITVKKTFTLHELLDGVKTMPQLEFLSVNHILNRNAGILFNQTLPVVHLSKLNEIHIPQSDLHAGSNFIQHLNVTPGCSLFFECGFVADADMVKDILENALQGLARFSERYLLSHRSNRISVACELARLTFNDGNHTEGTKYPYHQNLCWSWELWAPRFLHLCTKSFTRHFLFLASRMLPFWTQDACLHHLTIYWPSLLFTSELPFPPSVHSLRANEPSAFFLNLKTAFPTLLCPSSRPSSSII